jgi:hypothetical protein
MIVTEKGGHAHSQTMPEEFNRIVIGYLLDQQKARQSN